MPTHLEMPEIPEIENEYLANWVGSRLLYWEGLSSEDRLTGDDKIGEWLKLAAVCEVAFRRKAEKIQAQLDKYIEARDSNYFNAELMDGLVEERNSQTANAKLWRDWREQT